jgi:hypothetical protein
VSDEFKSVKKKIAFRKFQSYTVFQVNPEKTFKEEEAEAETG